jgi:ubiquinone/menaquinone biosynthesis C-methylase UbiE
VHYSFLWINTGRERNLTYYDSIAKLWHKTTGYKGGEFKRFVLNDLLLENIPDIEGQSILELGAGNGYFMPMVLQKYSGKMPARLVISDVSSRLIEIAQKNFRIEDAEYRVLNVVKPFPFAGQAFDCILATMIFNEVSTSGLRKALAECYRVLSPGGCLLITVNHPDFVDSLRQRKLLERNERGVLTMPGSGQLRLPVVVRKIDGYRLVLRESGFEFDELSVYPSLEVLNAKSGLRYAGNVPLALMFRCSK